jgi:hypothetical protein
VVQSVSSIGHVYLVCFPIVESSVSALPSLHGCVLNMTLGWIAVMEDAISRNAAYFNSHRMMLRYATEAHLR